MKDDELDTADEDVSKQRGRQQNRFQTWGVLLAIVLIVLWVEILADFQAARLVLIVLGGLAIALGLMGAAMGLGFFGFGICMAGDRFIGWLRRASQWPDE
jgi:Flp pilus assembly protein TadB